MTKNSRFNKLLLILIISVCSPGFAQTVKSVVPDSGHQGTQFGITINGGGTEWTFSSYFEVYFDSIGVTGSNVVIVNDSTLTATVSMDGKAAVGWRRIICADQFLNNYIKDSALRVILSIPSAPLLIAPLNNSQNQLQNPVMLWDSNGYAANFRIQIASDSSFINKLVDSTVSNTPYHVRPDYLQLGAKYYWRVNATNILGTSPWSPVWNFRVRTTGITILGNIIPDRYRLFNNYPNPFNPETFIKFSVPETSPVVLEIFDISGRLIEKIFNAALPPGNYSINWNAKSNPSGVYICRMTAKNFTESIRIIYLK